MSIDKGGQPWYQPVGRQGWRGHDAHDARASVLAAIGGEFVRRHPHAVEQSADPFRVAGCDGRQLYAATLTEEQRNPELFL